MKNQFEDTKTIRQALDQGASSLSLTVTARLARARNHALGHQKVAAAGFSLGLAGIGSGMGDTILPLTRTLMAILALTLGLVGTYYWNEFEQADENAEVDSALLADDLPIDAYTDHGFQAWLESSSSSSQQ